MPVIFEGNAGRVFAVPDRVASGLIQLANISGDGGILSYTLHNTIITGIGVGTAGNQQFLHTLGNDVYVYVFGDRVGQLELRGISFADSCPSSNSSEPHGFEKLLGWYNANRLAVRRDPVRAIIGRDTVIDGFVTGLTGDSEDAQNRSIRFRMQLTLLP
jgi:hypothetical protein